MCKSSTQASTKAPGAELCFVSRKRDIVEHCQSFDLSIWHIGMIFLEGTSLFLSFLIFNMQFRDSCQWNMPAEQVMRGADLACVHCKVSPSVFL